MYYTTPERRVSSACFVFFVKKTKIILDRNLVHVLFSHFVVLIVVSSYCNCSNYRSERLSHPLSWARHVIAALHHRWFWFCAESWVHVIFYSICCHLHAFHFTCSVAAIAGLRAIFPSFRFPPKGKKLNLTCPAGEIPWLLIVWRNDKDFINPLSLSIKLQIILLCFHTFLTEVVGRSC